jgi:hypothetical protein
MTRVAALAALLLLPAAAHARRDSSGAKRFRVDLLRLIDPNQDTVRGLSTLEERALILATNSEVQIPYEAPEEYDLTVVAERRELQGKLVVGLASGERQFDVVIDNFHQNEHRTGLHNLDGKHVVDREVDVKVGLVLKTGTPMTLVYSVRSGRVTVAVDGSAVVRWAGDFARLAVDARFRVPNRRAFFFGNAISRFRITKIDLVPVRGRGRPTR